MSRGRVAQNPFTRFMKYVRFARSGCWEWAGYTQKGYGRFRMPGSLSKAGKPSTHNAHRWLYELVHGPQELPLDHLCRNRKCVNPDHLEPVTLAENLFRSPITQASINRAKTYCPQGHKLEGVVKSGNYEGKRYCIPCTRRRTREWRARGR